MLCSAHLVFRPSRCRWLARTYASRDSRRMAGVRGSLCLVGGSSMRRRLIVAGSLLLLLARPDEASLPLIVGAIMLLALVLVGALAVSGVCSLRSLLPHRWPHRAVRRCQRASARTRWQRAAD